ncbi:hypothetical protein SAMN04488539_1056 [Corynebacterium timonense]|uniref:Uncharacterized protein n=1 Tax=Corynebacterium timonense TaxID=441500 RepID=A0A1H1PN00_9CORY|nr:hypothetical protein SAMN04488539_1056 [Corynebacterium timonense]
MSLRKFLWICAGVGTLLAGYVKEAPSLLLVTLLFVAAIPTALLIASPSEPKGGLKAVGLLAICIAIGAFVPLVLVFAFAGYIAVTWYSVTPAESSEHTISPKG